MKTLCKECENAKKQNNKWYNFCMVWYVYLIAFILIGFMIYPVYLFMQGSSLLPYLIGSFVAGIGFTLTYLMLVYAFAKTLKVKM